MPDNYAEALWRVVEKGKTPKAAVSALYRMLEAQGRLRLLRPIGKSFARVAEKKERASKITLSIAREKDARAAIREAASILAGFGAKKEDLALAVDPDIVGGWRLEGRGKLIDASYKKHLLNIYDNVIHS